MDFMDALNQRINEEREKRVANSTQLNLGKLLALLEQIPTEHGSDKEPVTIEFDFGTAHPTGLSSWRGSYAEIAINYDLGGYDNNNADQFAHTDLKDFVAWLRESIGKTYQGWKGGDFRMSSKTPVWVANDGNVGNTGVIGVIDQGYVVIIETAYCEF